METKTYITDLKCSHTREQLLEILDKIGSKKWISCEPVVFEFILIRMSDISTRRMQCSHQVPIGFETDLITAPVWALKKFGFDIYSLVLAPYLHDSVNRWPVLLCSTPGMPQSVRITRKEGDQLFKEALKTLDGLQDSRAHFFYKILRNWGWYAWLRWRFLAWIGKIK